MSTLIESEARKEYLELVCPKQVCFNGLIGDCVLWSLWKSEHRAKERNGFRIPMRKEVA